MSRTGTDPRTVPMGWTEVVVGLERPGGVPEAGGASAWARVPETVLGPDGTAHPAVLAVMADHVLAAGLRAAESGLNAIATTQMHVDLLSPLPGPGGRMTVSGRPLQTVDGGGCAVVEVCDERGALLARATGWFMEVKEAASGHHEEFYARAARDPDGARMLAEVLQRGPLPGGAPTAQEGLRAGSRWDGPRFEIDDELLNENGTVHGGALTMAGLLAAEAVMPDAGDYVLQSFAVDFLRGCSGAVDSRVHVRHGGRRFRSFSVELEAEGAVCAAVTCAYRRR